MTIPIDDTWNVPTMGRAMNDLLNSELYRRADYWKEQHDDNLRILHGIIDSLQKGQTIALYCGQQSVIVRKVEE